MAIYRLGDDVPRIPASAWVAESAEVIGKVELGEDVNIWCRATVRGDADWLRIGRRSNVQDGAVLHTDAGIELVVGEGVTVGHQVMLHGCTVGDYSLIGIQSVVLNGARIGRNCLVGAGSLVTEGKEFPDGSLIVGVPARVIRPLTEEQIAGLQRSAALYIENARRYRRELQRVA